MASYGDNGDCPLTIQIYHMSAVKPDARTPAKDSTDSKDSFFRLRSIRIPIQRVTKRNAQSTLFPSFFYAQKWMQQSSGVILNVNLSAVKWRDLPRHVFDQSSWVFRSNPVIHLDELLLRLCCSMKHHLPGTMTCHDRNSTCQISAGWWLKF